MRSLRVLVALLVVPLLATSCSSGDRSEGSDRRTSPERDEADGTAASADPDSPGTLDWGPCDAEMAEVMGLQCATLRVPLDPAEPAGEMIELALTRQPATGSADDRIGSLVLNPGGPGQSGVDFLARSAAAFPADLSRRFDLVSFDPRGVAESSPVQCIDDETKDAQLEGDLSPDTPEELERAVADQREFVEGCLAESGELLRHMSTADVAADLDRIRIAVGDEQLTYMGFSYGTEIGATYATLFPGSTRAMVLDGSVSPTATDEEETLTQALGFERTLANFVAACDTDTRCALGPDAAGAIAATREALAAKPVEVTTATGTRTLTIDLFDIALATALYDTTLWGAAAQATRDVRTTGGPMLLSLLDKQLGRQPDGSYDNSSDAQSMVICADTVERPTVESAAESAARVEAAAPTFGQALGWGALGCLDWPLAATPPTELTGAGAPPILVVGTVGDPATPYEWSEQMTAALESATLLTYEGDGHTAFLRGGPCIADAVVTYLVDLTVPAEGTRCPAQAAASGFGGLRDEFVSQLVAAGTDRRLAECIIDGIVDEVGPAAFDRMALDEDTALFRLVMAQTLSCAGKGN